MAIDSLIQTICVWILPILFSITLHEVAHGWCAYKLGDPTAKLLGRLTINPIKHIDPIGTIAIPLLLGLLSGFSFLFGWAKPVPITTQNLKGDKRKAMALVAIAGPFANFIMAFLWGILFIHFFRPDPTETSSVYMFFSEMSKAGFIFNIVLIAVNVLPIPPLDGSKVLSNLLPPKYAYYFDKVEPYGFFIIILLCATHLIGILIKPIINGLIYFFIMILS